MDVSGCVSTGETARLKKKFSSKIRLNPMEDSGRAPHMGHPPYLENIFVIKNLYLL